MFIKRKNIILVLVQIVLLQFYACEGDTLSSMKDFEANTHPVITAFTDDIGSTDEIYPGFQFNLEVQAHDVEGESLEYEFKSDSATFRNIVVTETGATVECFIRPGCTSSSSIVLTVVVRDEKGAESEKSIDVGDGRSSPSISVTWPSDTNLSTTRSVDISADCSGYYQVTTLSYFADSGVDLYDYSFNYASPPTHTRTVGTGSADLDLTVSGTYTVYIVFKDLFGREVSKSAEFTVP